MGASVGKIKKKFGGGSDNTLPVCNDEHWRTAEKISTSTSIGVRRGCDDGGVDAHLENAPINNSTGGSDTGEEYYSASDGEEYYFASDGEGNSEITNQITSEMDLARPRTKTNIRRSRRVKQNQQNEIATPRSVNQFPRLRISTGNRHGTKRKRSTNYEEGEDQDSANPGRKNRRAPKRRSTSTNELVSESSTYWTGSLEEYQDIRFKEKFIDRLTKRKQGETTMKRMEDDPRREVVYNNASETFSVGGIKVKFEAKSLICCMCDRKFEGNSKTPGWNAKMHSLEKAVTTHVVGKHLGGFKCDECGKGLSSYFNWRQHKELHSKINCQVCGKKITSNKSLKHHMIGHMNAEEKTEKGLMTPTTTTEKSYPCLQCPKTFGKAQHLTQHNKWVHSEKEMVQCPKCGKSMSKEGYRRSHSIYVCPDDDQKKKIKRIKCTLCIDTFKKDSSLRGHMKRVHALDRKNELKNGKYCCEWCERMFENRKAVTQHKVGCKLK